ncbi:VOC family protein [Amycolatopsis sp. K13G38]|uniref:VOC family protein n=1 Tax=Amycolatopsis acididurans TaxID=2724524 RepID=A0ABX1JGB3_9PSEU|nr:VOC family protein [Amycolatopsis acididurans]NKQ58830.1 VOC family protein [Amycolatopsis acididurans]
MSTKIFVNLPVKDLQKSIEFFTQVGYTFNKQFTDENATSMVISEDIYAMLLTEQYFRTFTDREIVDATKSAEVLIALSADSREAVDELVNKALAAGGTETREPQDHGFMYGRSYADLDGHVWEIMWMDPAAVEG